MKPAGSPSQLQLSPVAAALPVTAGAAATAALAAEPDPVFAMLAQEQAAYDWWMAAEDDADMDRRSDIYRDLENRIYAT